MDHTNADNINRFIFLIFSFMISAIIVLVIVSTGPSQFGTKASLFMAIFIFFIPACTGLLTLKFVKGLLLASTPPSSPSTTPGAPLLLRVEYDRRPLPEFCACMPGSRGRQCGG